MDLLARSFAPDFGAALSPFVVTPAGIVEFAMVAWLLFSRIQAPQPDEPVAAAA